VLAGGFGSAVAETLAPLGIPVTVLGVPDAFIPQGSQNELLHQLGLYPEAVAARIRDLLRRPTGMVGSLSRPGS
jgi:1-deoxy-D-xylulose-5-phosphate synthase